MTRRLFPVFVIFGVLLIQLFPVQRPLAGHFGSYQQVMGGMAKNFMREHFSDLLRPKTDLLVGDDRGLHLNQYPFPSLIAAVGASTGAGSVEFWGRLQSIGFNLLSLALTAFLACRLLGPPAGFLAAFLYAFSPYALVNGQLFFSEPMAVACLLGSLAVLFGSDSVPSMARQLMGGFLFSLAVTGRVHFAVFLPLLWVPLCRQGILKALPAVVCVSLAALALPAAWYFHTYQASMASTHVLTNIFFQVGARTAADPHYLGDWNYHWRILDILSRHMLTPLAFPFLLLGMVPRAGLRRESLLLLLGGLALGSAIGVLSPQKVMAHDFYLAGLFPFVILTAASGLARAAQAPALSRPRVWIPAALLYLALAAPFAAGPLLKVPPETRQDLETAAAVKARTPSEARGILAGDSVATLLYYADRPAWTMTLSQVGKPLPYYLHNPQFTARPESEIAREEEAMKNAVTWLEYFRAEGASFLAAASREALDRNPELVHHLKTLYRQVSGPDDRYYLFDLTAPPSGV